MFLTVIKVRKLPFITLKLTQDVDRKAANDKAFIVIRKKLTFLTSFPWVNMKSRKPLGARAGKGPPTVVRACCCTHTLQDYNNDQISRRLTIRPSRWRPKNSAAGEGD